MSGGEQPGSARQLGPGDEPTSYPEVCTATRPAILRVVPTDTHIHVSSLMDDGVKRERNVMIDLTRGVYFCLRGKLSANMARAFAIAALAAAIIGRTANAAATLDQVPYGTTQAGRRSTSSR